VVKVTSEAVHVANKAIAAEAPSAASPVAAAVAKLGRAGSRVARSRLERSVAPRRNGLKIERERSLLASP
jgi:hypothetical protein